MMPHPENVIEEIHREIDRRGIVSALNLRSEKLLINFNGLQIILELAALKTHRKSFLLGKY
ncbi:hypothetical protein [Candidatus Liberibacter sp.]|uniref:hypothetical protein n=1 Tax=Candidatus Liberibacter sp. TaxID=34022 RepID=UPI0015F485C8|nr:hypothetical protein [Candidatus Liberibacter sp.]MBA5723655.1 hypothetical protein [Candidatus Liberibacter sp.]